MASDFDTLLDSFVVKPEVEANNEPSSVPYLLQSRDWKGRNILVHEESLPFLVAQKKIDNQSYDVEFYIITPELKSVFSSAGFNVKTRTLFVWKDDTGQHGISMINTDSQAPICVRGREYMALATTGWCRITSVKVKDQNDYRMEPVTVTNEPSWRGSYKEMLKEAIFDRLVDSKEHPVVQDFINQGHRTTTPPIPLPKKTASRSAAPQAQSAATAAIGQVLDD